MKYLDPELGKPLPEQSYAEDCRLYDPDPNHPGGHFHNLWVGILRRRKERRGHEGRATSRTILSWGLWILWPGFYNHTGGNFQNCRYLGKGWEGKGRDGRGEEETGRSYSESNPILKIVECRSYFWVSMIGRGGSLLEQSYMRRRVVSFMTQIPNHPGRHFHHLWIGMIGRGGSVVSFMTWILTIQADTSTTCGLVWLGGEGHFQSNSMLKSEDCRFYDPEPITIQADTIAEANYLFFFMHKCTTYWPY